MIIFQKLSKTPRPSTLFSFFSRSVLRSIFSQCTQFTHLSRNIPPPRPIDILTRSLQEARREYEARQEPWRKFQARREQRALFNAALKVGIRKYGERLFEEFKKEGVQCLHAYSTDKYTLVNKALRMGTTNTARNDIRKIILGATKALQTSIVLGVLNRCDPNAVLYRGCVGIPEVPKVGGTYSDKAFFSTSWKLSQAVQFLNGGRESYLFRVFNPKSAQPIYQLSKYKKEGEFLFLPSTMFRVLDVKRGQIVKGAFYKVTIIDIAEI